MKKTVILGLCAMMICAGKASAMSEWAISESAIANSRGLVTESLLWGSVTENITREEFCYLAMNLYKNMGGKVPEVEESPFADTDNRAVAEAYSLGIINGKTEHMFYPESPITRQEIAKIIMLTVNNVKNKDITQKEVCEICHFEDFEEVHDWAIDYIEGAVRYDIINGISKTRLFPLGNATREQALVIMNRAYENFAEKEKVYSLPEITISELGEKLSLAWSDVDDAESYIVVLRDKDKNVVFTQSASENKLDISVENLTYGEYSLIVGAKVDENAYIYSAAAKLIKSAPEYVDKYPTINDKKNRVFPDGKEFSDYDTAKANMKTVTVPVWKLDEKGNKYSATLEVEVNVNLADDIVKIFSEIYKDHEKFPIKNLGGFSWRTTAFGSVSQHSFGTCIDINWDENYYCYPSGQAITGSFWKPYENPFSITPDGSVVKNFKKYGWTWGGDWTNLRDYMHFSYLGK